MRSSEPGYIRCARYDQRQRRAIWYRKNDDGSIDICAGREGDDGYAKLAPGSTIDEEILAKIEDILSTGEWIVRLQKDEVDMRYEPRHSCESWFNETGLAPVQLSKNDFDNMCENDEFADGPHIETFGDNPPEPYNPFRQAFGKLKDGRGVFCEVHRSRADDPC